jgi:hypothetical protein
MAWVPVGKVWANVYSRFFLLAAYAHLHAVDQARQHMRGVEFAVGQLVAHAGP